MLPEIHGPVPGPRSQALAAELRGYESRNVTYLAGDFPIFWQRAAGVNVWDADGNRFLDLTSAFGVAGLGHTNQAVARALREQSADLLHAMGDVHPSALKGALCRELSALTFERWGVGTGRTILGNSGFEAVEAALKTALLHTGRPGVIAFHGGYHGLGYGALAAGGLPAFREPFRRQLAEFATLLPYPASDAELREAFRTREIAAVLVEPMQGRGGVIVPPGDFLPRLRRRCDEAGSLLIADEIYTGLNRTGALFACDHAGVVPDLICLGKALTSGFPLSACVGRAAVMDAWPLSTGEALHTSTFLGNPLGCAMALASLAQHARPETARAVQERGAALREALAGLRSPFIAELRGAGLMLGLELTDSRLAGAMITRCLQQGLLLLADGPRGNVLSFAPPFAVSDEEIAFAVARLQENFTSLPGSIS